MKNISSNLDGLNVSKNFNINNYNPSSRSNTTTNYENINLDYTTSSDSSTESIDVMAPLHLADSVKENYYPNASNNLSNEEIMGQWITYIKTTIEQLEAEKKKFIEDHYFKFNKEHFDDLLIDQVTGEYLTPEQYKYSEDALETFLLNNGYPINDHVDPNKYLEGVDAFNEYAVNEYSELYSKYFKEITGITYEEYVDQINTYNSDINSLKSSKYSLEQQLKESPYLDLIETDAYKKFYQDNPNLYQEIIEIYDSGKYKIFNDSLYVDASCITEDYIYNGSDNVVTIDGKIYYKYQSPDDYKKDSQALETYLVNHGYSTDPFYDPIAYNKGVEEFNNYIDTTFNSNFNYEFLYSMINTKDGAYLNEDEKKVYIYLLCNEGNDAAADYLVAIEDRINQRKGREEADRFLASITDENGEINYNAWSLLLANGEGILMGIENFGEGLANIFTTEGMISDNQYAQMYILEALTNTSGAYVNSLAQVILEEKGEDEATEFINNMIDTTTGEINLEYAKEVLTEEEYAKLEYKINKDKNTILDNSFELGTSFGNMLPSMAITMALSYCGAAPAATSLIGNVLMGMSAGGNAKNQALVSGNDLLSSTIYGILSGTSETCLGLLLGNIPGLNENASLSFKGIFKEGMEEFLQEYVDAGLRCSILGEEINLDELNQDAIKSFVYGALMSFGTNTVSTGLKLIINGKSVELNSMADFKAFFQILNDSGILIGDRTEDGVGKTIIIDESITNKSEMVDIMKSIYKDAEIFIKTADGNISYAGYSGYDVGSDSSITLDSNDVSSIKYDKPSTIEYVKQYISSNIRKFFYKDTSQFDGLNEQIMQNGLYHFTTSADAILESGYIKASNFIDSYATPLSPTTKSFFFNGVPEVGAIATNIGSIPVKATAIKIDATSELVNNPKLKLRYIDDMAITYDGNFNLDGYNAQKCFFGLTVEDGRLVYRQISEESYNNYENTTLGKELSEYVSNKNNLTAIKSDFLAKIFEKNGISNLSSVNVNNSTSSLTDDSTHIVDVNSIIYDNLITGMEAHDAKYCLGSAINELYNYLYNGGDINKLSRTSGFGQLVSSLSRSELETYYSNIVQIYNKTYSYRSTINSSSDTTIENDERLQTRNYSDKNGYQITDKDFGNGWLGTQVKNGFLSTEQVNNMINNINIKGYISKETGDYIDSLFDGSSIYIKTIGSANLNSIFKNGVMCLGNSTSGLANIPKSISDVTLENTVTKVESIYELVACLKNAIGISQGGNPIDGTIILKVPKGLSESDILYFNSDFGCYCIYPQFVNAFLGCNNSSIVSDPIFNDADTSNSKKYGFQFFGEKKSFFKPAGDLTDLSIISNDTNTNYDYSLNVNDIINSFMFEESISDVQLQQFTNQVNNFLEISQMPKEIHNPKLDENGKVILKNGTLIHGTRFNEAKLESISNIGILSGQAFGIPEDGETYCCADFYKINGDLSLESVNKNLQESIVNLTPFGTKNNSRKSVAFIVNSNMETQKLFNYDCYATGTIESDITRTFVNQYGLLNFEGDIGLSSILYGVPSNCIEGIIVGDDIASSSDKIDIIRKQFPNCYITDRNGTLIYNPANNMKNKVLDSLIQQLKNIAKNKNMTLEELGAQKGQDVISTEVQMKADQLAAEVSRKAKISEPQITSDLQLLESNSAKLIGLEHKLKSEDSISRKILSDSKLSQEDSIYVSLEDAADNIGDSIRYTMLLEENNYVYELQKILFTLEEKGYTIKKFKNFWGNKIYQGVNTSIISPDGVVFELQFHTEESFFTKEKLNHLYYEISRNDFVDEKIKEISDKIMIINQSNVEIPAGIIEYKWK